MRTLIFLSILILPFIGFTQKYNTMFGLRFDEDIEFGLTQRIGNRATIDLNVQPGILTDISHYSALFKVHMPLITKRFNAFAGVGPYTNSFERWIENNNSIVENQYGLAVGLGAEITIMRLTLGVDYRPLYNLNNSLDNKFSSSSGVSLKYVLNPRKRTKSNKVASILKK